jgi:uncharacterized membrane protein YkoI
MTPDRPLDGTCLSSAALYEQLDGDLVMSKWFLGGSAAVILAISTGSASGQTGVSQQAHPDEDFSTFAGTPTTLVQIISHVEQASGGRVLDIRFSASGGEPSYVVAVDQGGQVLFERLAREDGQLSQVSAEDQPTSMLHWRARADVDLAEKAKVTLVDAITAAEDQAGGAPAVAAGIAMSASNPTNDVTAYNVLVLRDGIAHRISVDDQTGEVIANPRAMAEPG